MSAHSDSMKRSKDLAPAVRCNGKHPFASAALASRIARAGNRRRDINYSAYRCGVCSFWHTGTAPKGQGRKLVEKRRKRAIQAIREGERE